MARRKITFSDWTRGAVQSIRDGQAMNPLATQRYVNAAHDERVAREAERYPRPAHPKGWYTKWSPADGTIQLLIDKNGDITTTYPHVHVIHDEPGGEVRIVASLSKGNHVAQEVLPGTASGNDVNAAIGRMIQKL